MKIFAHIILACALFAASFSGTAHALNTGDDLILFKAHAMSGETVNLAQIVKNKPVLLFFWASW